MVNIKINYILISMLWLLTAIVHAETIYVIDELKIGLHEDRTIDSPIMKLVPSGTQLSVIERDNDLIHVQEPEGVRGWINSKYVINEKPGKVRFNELEIENKNLQKEIESLKSITTDAENAITPGKGTDAQKELEQQLKSERLKVGELQAHLTDLKSKIGNIDNSDKFLADIEQLKQENKLLISQLESSGIEVRADMGSSNNNFVSDMNWKQITITFVIVFIIGMAGGFFILDYLGRRRHGGFRV
jgi:SH3 domain protein